jgi:hypothetical protein
VMCTPTHNPPRHAAGSRKRPQASSQTAKELGFVKSSGPIFFPKSFADLAEVAWMATRNAMSSKYEIDKRTIVSPGEIRPEYLKPDAELTPQEIAGRTRWLQDLALLNAEEWLHALQHAGGKFLSTKGSAYAAQKRLPYTDEEDVAAFLSENQVALTDGFWSRYAREGVRPAFGP